MTELIPLLDSDFATYVKIIARAYPGIRLEDPQKMADLAERLRKEHHDDEMVTVLGAYRGGKLHGGMVYFDLQMQCFEALLACGGVGMIAVDLLHKKEKVARDMVRHFLDHYNAQNAPLVALYPFRPDFYKQMGFGYGSKMHQYRVRPDALPNNGSKAHLRYLGPADQAAVEACYERQMRQTHGMMTRRAVELGPRMLESPQMTTVGYVADTGDLGGYLAFRFESANPANFVMNNIVVKEMVCHSPEVMAEFFTFLHSQNDQVNRIIFNTQDEHFHHALSDPRSDSEAMIPSVYHESHVSGVGLLYRVLSVPRLFAALGGHDFGGVSLTLKITLEDSFFPANAGSTIVRFDAGRATVAPDAEAEVEIALDVAEFSPMILGCVPFRWLHTYRLAAISDEAYLGAVDRAFQTVDKPVCITDF
jgi:predicted acetyltransferase